MRWPLDDYTITQGFHAAHEAVDLGADEGTTIKAPVSGIVIAILSNWKPGGYFGGNYVKIRGDSGYTFYMGHMSKTATKLNARVKEGEVVGYVGSTGQSTGPHVHFEVSKDGAMYDARKVIPKGGQMVTADVAAVIVRAFCGRSISAQEKKTYVGKESAQAFMKRVKSWGTHKTAVARAKSGDLVARDFLMSELRGGYPAVKAKDVGGSYVEVSEMMALS